jgi:hypothetical protein
MPTTDEIHIESDTCDLHAQVENGLLLLRVSENSFDGKVNALTCLTQGDAQRLRGVIDHFLSLTQTEQT